MFEHEYYVNCFKMFIINWFINNLLSSIKIGNL